jgi:hypothetical protein
LQSISGVSAINPLVAIYDIHGEQNRKHKMILSDAIQNSATRNKFLICAQSTKPMTATVEINTMCFGFKIKSCVLA